MLLLLPDLARSRPSLSLVFFLARIGPSCSLAVLSVLASRVLDNQREESYEMGRWPRFEAGCSLMGSWHLWQVLYGREMGEKMWSKGNGDLRGGDLVAYRMKRRRELSVECIRKPYTDDSRITLLVTASQRASQLSQSVSQRVPLTPPQVLASVSQSTSDPWKEGENKQTNKKNFPRFGHCHTLFNGPPLRFGSVLRSWVPSGRWYPSTTL